METYKLYTDGSYYPSQKLACIGGYLLDPQGEVVFEFSEQVDATLSKYHELVALEFGLKKCLEHCVEHVDCYSDDIYIRRFNNDILSEWDTKPIHIKQSILSLKQYFKSIQFKHIRRNKNKRADKLANKAQLQYFYQHIFFRERKDIHSKKILTIPNIVCLEDYLDKGYSLTESQSLLSIESQSIDYVFDLNITVQDTENSQATLQIVNKDKSIVYYNHACEFETKKVNAKCLDLLYHGFQFFEAQFGKDKNIGLSIFSSDLHLKKFEMVLRKRFIFPQPETPLAQRFKEAAQIFNTIYLLEESEENSVEQEFFC